MRRDVDSLSREEIEDKEDELFLNALVNDLVAWRRNQLSDREILEKLHSEKKFAWENATTTLLDELESNGAA